MKINQIIESSTSSGSVASIAMPMTTQRRSEIGQGVYGNKKAGNLLKGKATKKPFVNSITEGKMKALELDLSWPPEGLSDAAFKRKYGKTKDEMRKELKKPSQPVQEETISEEDLILIPGHAMKRTGFIKRDPDKAEHEGETLKNSLHTIIRTATHLNNALSERDSFPEWVSEKIGAIKSNLVTVMDYLISEKEMNTLEMTGGVVAGGVAFEDKHTKVTITDEDKWFKAVKELNTKKYYEEGDYVLTDSGYALKVHGQIVAEWNGMKAKGWVLK